MTTESKYSATAIAFDFWLVVELLIKFCHPNRR
jgi:hypothetical protein